MATFVLVHGAWGGAWYWERKLVPLLEAEGHRVIVPDLPGHGDDHAPVAEMTLESNARRVQEAIEGADEPVVLVGHSMGGMAVTQAAEYVPDQITRLVYVTAFLPGDGQSLPELAGALAGSDNVQPQLVVNEAEGTAGLKEDALVDLFYAECSKEDAEYAVGMFGIESLAAMGAPVHITEAGAERVPRAYVECLRDRAITIELQRHMQAARPCAPVLQIDTDHSPMLSRPDELAAHLLSLA
jgi:pimeloyl-ACP methyl ester carboxylesterase